MMKYDPVRIIKNLILDVRIGGVPLAGSIRTKYGEQGAKDTANSSYAMVREIFEQIGVASNDVLVDIGCGKGRVINWWLLHYPHNKITGIELDPNIAVFTKRRLRKYKNVNIIAGDAITNIPREGTIFYMYNPFNAEIMERFKNQLIEMNMLDIKLVYLNAVYIEVFENDPDWCVQRINGRISALHPTALIVRESSS